MSVPKELRRLMEARGWTQQDLERYSGISQATISRILAGRAEDPKVNTIYPIARALGVTVEEIMTGKKPRNQSDERRKTWQAPRYLSAADDSDPPKGFAKVPIIDNHAKIYAYDNIPTEEVTGYVLVAKELLQERDQVVAVVVAIDDQTMHPIINGGDTVFIDVSTDSRRELQDQLCLAEVNDELVVRWLRKTANGYYLEIANKELERVSGPMLVPPKDLHLVGKVIGAWRIFNDC